VFNPAAVIPSIALLLPVLLRVFGVARLGVVLAAVGGLATACSGSTPWAAEPSPGYDDELLGDFVPPVEATQRTLGSRVRRIGASRPENLLENPDVVTERIALAHSDGQVLGTFRNTYYDFPSEGEFAGESTPLYDGSCNVIAQVRRDFHDALCVQGSGALSSGSPVSFAKRDCSCARTCPRTGQKICFESLDKARFPWGRGATGRAVTPLLTVAVDSSVVALETALYIPEFEGLPRDLDGTSRHDGCFIAQDRGLKVTGKHIDVFTGEPALTRLWNRLLPSNRGVTVVVGSPKCARAN
jgi:3D (Asp-Asp-Asp) domain-containing protein